MSLGASKPTTLPRWADVGGAIVTPPSGKQDVGWADSEEPPAEYMNWWQNLVYTWWLWLSFYFFSTGEFKVQSSTEAATTPVTTFYDYKGQSRQHVDHLGYLGGQVTNWWEQWRTTGTTEPPMWTFTAAGGTRAYNDPDANMPYRNVTLSVPAVASQQAALTTNALLYADATRSLVLETDIRLGAANWNGAGIITLLFGLQFSNAGAWNGGADLDFTPQVGFIRTNFNAGGFTLSQVTSSVALALNTTYRLRIEIIGSSNSSAAANRFTVRWYVNGTLLRSYTDAAVNLAADLVRVRCNVVNGVTALAAAFQMGPIRLSWNHRLTQDLV